MRLKPDQLFLLSLVAIAALLAFGLEAAGSKETMAILGLVAVPAMATYLKQDKTDQKVEQATEVAQQAAEIGRDTNARTQALQHEFNGKFEDKIRTIVRDTFREEWDAIDETLDARIRAGVTAVQHQRDEHFDVRMRDLIRTELPTQESSAQTESRSRARR